MGYQNLVGSFIYKEPVFRAKLDALAENDAALKADNWAQNTKTVFFQAAVPAGWTQDVSQNDKALRVVGSIGGGGAGGSQALSASFALAHTHTLPTPADGAHVHDYPDHTHEGGPAAGLRPGTTPIASNSGYLYAYVAGTGTVITQLKGRLKTPGALTLGTEPDHDHGAPLSALTDFGFAYVDIIVGTKNAPGGTYTDQTSYWSSGTKVDFDPFDIAADNDAYNLANLMPTGTVLIFGQASAPAGWTKLSTVNDRALRFVSGAGGAASAGGQILSATVNLEHTHTIPAEPDHTHTFVDHQHLYDDDGSRSPYHPGTQAYVVESVSPGFLAIQAQLGVGAPTAPRTVYRDRTTNSGAGSTAAAGGHTHLMPPKLADLTLAYLDVIQASKDSAGAPYAYIDLTAVFAWKKLVTYQRMNRLAQNDAHIKFHVTPSGTKAFFFMATPPLGWTKITSHHDKALRIVSGSSGGSPGGGAQGLSSTFLLAHFHTVPTDPDHTHGATHTHPIATDTQTVTAPGPILVDNEAISLPGSGDVGSGPGRALGIVTEQPNETPDAAGAHNHGGDTDSQLTDVTLAYADVIYCSKN